MVSDFILVCFREGERDWSNLIITLSQLNINKNQSGYAKKMFRITQ